MMNELNYGPPLVLSSWLSVLSNEDRRLILTNLKKITELTKSGVEVYPPREKIFNALRYFPINKTKVVVLGQDPYHSYGKANGLAFAVDDDSKIPQSLRNIFKEIISSFDKLSTKPDLNHWANQGVLLLNRYLTVEKNNPMSHEDWGWDRLVFKWLEWIIQNVPTAHFILLGVPSRNLFNSVYDKIKREENFEDRQLHAFYTSHPSPYSVNLGFKGSGIFQRVNYSLMECGETGIDW